MQISWKTLLFTLIFLAIACAVFYFMVYREHVIESMTDVSTANNDQGDFVPGLFDFVPDEKESIVKKTENIVADQVNSDIMKDYAETPVGNVEFTSVADLDVTPQCSAGDTFPNNQLTGQDTFLQNTSETSTLPVNLFPQNQLTPSELLPKDTNSVYAQMNPSQCDLQEKNFLEAGYHIGISTVGQSNPIPNLQLRSDPLIPPRNVSPWGQSTKQPDTNRRYFEIGSC